MSRFRLFLLSWRQWAATMPVRPPGARGPLSSVIGLALPPRARYTRHASCGYDGRFQQRVCPSDKRRTESDKPPTASAPPSGCPPGPGGTERAISRPGASGLAARAAPLPGRRRVPGPGPASRKTAVRALRRRTACRQWSRAQGPAPAGLGPEFGSSGTMLPGRNGRSARELPGVYRGTPRSSTRGPALPPALYGLAARRYDLW
jgi:hypothetical protein